MNPNFTDRLNKILPRLVSDDFLQGRGLGNEITFHIFDYPPDKELEMRGHIDFLLKQIPKRCQDLRVTHINLFAFVLDYLKERNLLEPAIRLQKEKGDAALQKALEAPLRPEKLAPVFVDALHPERPDLVLISGVGSAYPLVRSHGLLNNLHSRIGNMPLVLFYPGIYDGQRLKLFGQLDDNNYYRAFKLVA
ncbi:MAG: DUF1788 domain-containing protein [Pseudomonadota bacterium]